MIFYSLNLLRKNVNVWLNPDLILFTHWLVTVGS